VRVGLLVVRLLLVIVGSLVLLIGVAWAFGALWFDFPIAALRRPLAALFGLSAIGALFLVRPYWRAQLGVVCAIALVAHYPPFQYARLAAGRGPGTLRRKRW